MPQSRVTHNTFAISRTYSKPAGRTFAAFSELAAKRRWYAEGGAHDLVSYELDFRVGGKEILVGRMRPGTPVAGAVITWTQTFEKIEKDRLIVFSQTVDVADRRISCALITADFEPVSVGCALQLMHQAVYFDGADGPKMREMGWQALLKAAESVVG